MTNPSAAPAPAGSPLAAEPVWETDWSRFLRTLVLWTLLPSVVLAPAMQYAFSPQLDGVEGLLRAFFGLVQGLGFVVGLVLAGQLLVAGMGPGGSALLRVCFVFEASEHGVALRDSRGNLLGDTADGSLRVTGINVQAGRGMHGGLRLEHRGDSFIVLPKQFVAPSPGMTATPTSFTTRTVSNAMYERLRRHAA